MIWITRMPWPVPKTTDQWNFCWWLGSSDWAGLFLKGCLGMLYASSAADRIWSVFGGYWFIFHNWPYDPPSTEMIKPTLSLQCSPLDIASLCFKIFSSPFDHFILKWKEVNTILKKTLIWFYISSLFPSPFVSNHLLAQLNLSQDVFPFIERKRIWGHCDANTQTRWLPPSEPAQKDCQSPPFTILCHLEDFLSEEKWKFFYHSKK